MSGKTTFCSKAPLLTKLHELLVGLQVTTSVEGCTITYT